MLNKDREQVLKEQALGTFLDYLRKGPKVDDPKKILDEIMKEGKHCELQDDKGIAPLHMACLLGLTYIVERIVTIRPDLMNSPDKQGRTPFYWACMRNEHVIMDYLVEKGADINAPDKERDTPLHHACMRRGYKTIEYLVEKGANVDATNENGDYPISRLVAATGNSEENCKSIKLMLDKSKNGADLAKQALKCCAVNHVNPNKKTQEMDLLDKYIDSKSTQKGEDWVNKVNQSTKTQEIIK